MKPMILLLIFHTLTDWLQHNHVRQSFSSSCADLVLSPFHAPWSSSPWFFYLSSDGEEDHHHQAKSLAEFSHPSLKNQEERASSHHVIFVPKPFSQSFFSSCFIERWWRWSSFIREARSSSFWSRWADSCSWNTLGSSRLTLFSPLTNIIIESHIHSLSASDHEDEMIRRPLFKRCSLPSYYH